MKMQASYGRTLIVVKDLDESRREEVERVLRENGLEDFEIVSDAPADRSVLVVGADDRFADPVRLLLEDAPRLTEVVARRMERIVAEPLDLDGADRPSWHSPYGPPVRGRRGR